MLIARSAVGVMTVLLSVARLLPAGSFTPTGAVMLAWLVMVPLPLTVAVAVNVALPPESRFTAALMSPAPAAGQTEPALAVQVQVTPLSCAGNRSVTVAPVTALGPLLVATMVYVTVPPWFTATRPSVLVIARSAVAVITVLLSVAELLPAGSFTPGGAAIVAVLLTGPVPVAVAVMVNVAAPPARRSTLAVRSPAPLAGQAEPPVATQVHVAAVNCAGITSLTIAPVTLLGPALLATTV